MPIVEIDGVGRVEVDDSFLKMSPAQQEATINEIAASASRTRSQSPAPTAPAPQAAPMPAPMGPPGQPPAPDASPTPKPDGTNFDFDKLERDYQAQQAVAGKDRVDATAPKTSNLEALGLGGLDGLSFGFDDELGSGLAAVIPGLGKKSVWDGASLSDAYNTNVKAYRDEKDAAFNEHPAAYIGGGLASAFVPWGAASKLVSGGKGVIGAVKAAEELGSASNLARFGRAARNGAGAGALYGVGSADSGLENSLEGAASGALLGTGLGVGGEAIIGTALRALPKARASRFARNQAEKNPYAAYDAEIAQDLNSVVKDTATSPTDAKARALVSAKQINNLEQRYAGRFKDLISKVEDDPVEALKLKNALEGRHTLTTEDINGLRGTVAGDAIADAVIKIQRLRKLTPEVARDKSPLSIAGNVASTVLDFAPGVPGIVGRTVRGVTRSVAGDAEAARVHSAERVIKNIKGYSKLAELVGPSGQQESSQALWKAAQDAIEREAQDAELAQQAATKQRAMREATKAEKPEVDAYRRDRRANVKLAEAADPELQRRADLLKQTGKDIRSQDRSLSAFDDALNAPEPAPAPMRDPTQRELAGFRRSIADPAPDMRDLTNPVPTDRALAQRVQSRNRALSQLESAVPDWEAKLADPSTAPAPQTPKAASKSNAKDAVVESNITQGIVGDGGTHNAFTARVGVSKDDLMRIIDKAQEDFPEVASELQRIRYNYPTKDRTFGSAIIPRLKAIRDEMGIKPAEAGASAPKSIPVDEEAQKRLEGINLSKAEGPTTGKPLKIGDEIPANLAGGGEGLDIGGPTNAEDFSGYIAKRVVPESEAQSAVAAELASAGKGAEASTTPLGDGTVLIGIRQLRQVDRPVQWEAGKSRYQSLANSTIADLNNDIRISGEALSAIKRVPEKIRDNFKTTDEATSYIENEVLPELEVAKVPRDEIDRIKSYLYEIASHKPYATQEAYEAGTRANPRGRPRR